MTNAQTAVATDTGLFHGPHNVTILDRVREFIGRYVSFSEEAQGDILALYALHTHAFKYAKTTPYLYVTSAEKQSGKTRTLETLEQICRNATRADNLSSAVMFRMIQAKSPTLMIDEVDTIFAGARDDEMRGVLNSGYKSGGFIYRAIGNPLDESGGLVEFNTFCPKILAGIDNGHLPDTIMDRAIRITLRRKAPGSTVEEFYAEDVEEIVADLRDDIGAWVAAHGDILADRTRRPARIEGLSDRANEIARPLLAIAAQVPGWNVRARNALKSLLGDAEAKLSPQGRALLAIRDWFDAHPDATQIPSAVACDITGVNGKQLGAWLTAYGISSYGTTQGGKRFKAYRRGAFPDAFTRYLPAQD